MVGSKVSVCLLALAMVGLAGCMGEKDGGDALAAAGLPPAEPPEVSDATGSVTGQIVSDAFRPIPAIDVALAERSGAQTLTRTDGDGRFTFNDVPPGSYRVRVAHPCCRPTSDDVVVAAGNVSVVNLVVPVLTPAELGFPYSVEREWKGLLACATHVVVAAVYGCPLDANDDYKHRFNVSAGLVMLVVGMRWDQGAQTVADNLELRTYQYACEPCRRGYEPLRGASPLRGSIDDGNMSAEAFRFADIESQATLEFQVGAAAPNVVYQQPFEVRWVEFYREPGPDGHDPFGEA